MANEVNIDVTVRNFNDEAASFIDRLFPNGFTGDSNSMELTNPVFDTDFTNETWQRDWAEDNIDSKWITGMLISKSETKIWFTLTSAWQPPFGWIEKLTERLIELAPDVSLACQIQDEGFEFCGAAYFSKLYSNIEWLGDVDGDLFWSDDEYRDKFYEEINTMLETYREYHTVLLTSELKND